MRQRLTLTFLLLALLPYVAKAQWTFDIVSVEAYINDHKKQRSLLLARSTLEYSNKLLHEYSKDATVEYKELNVDLDRYTRAFDVIDVMYQSLRTVLNAKDTYTTVSDRIGDYKEMLTEFNDKVLKRGKAEPEDLLILTINKKAIEDIANDGEQLYKSLNDLVLYATGAAACSTASDVYKRQIWRHGDTYRYASATGKKRYTRHAAVRKSSTEPLAAGAVPEDWIINEKRKRICT